MKRLIASLALLSLVASSAFGVTAKQTKLYGQVFFFSDSLANAKVTVTLTGANWFATSDKEVASGQIVTYANSDGYWSADVYGTDSLVYPTGRASYTVTFEQPELQTSGIVVQVSGLSIPADGDSTSFREVLVQ